MKSSKLFWVVLLLVCLIFLSSVLPRGFFLPARFMFQTVATPFESALSSVAFFFRDVSGTLSSIGDLKKENAQLNEMRYTWESDQSLLLDIKKENEDLREALSLPLRTKFALHVATVIARDPASRGKWLFIDTGSFHDMKQGMVVVATGGVMIGIIDEVYPQSARVKLLSHPDHALPVRIAGQNTRGIVHGEYGLGMMIGMISQTDTVRDGDSVVTDNLENDIPSGLLIGTVQSLQPSPDHLFLEASVISPVRVDALRFVSVLVAEMNPE